MKSLHLIAMLSIAFPAFLIFHVNAGNLPEIKFEKYELPNGLDVILHEDHSIPMVAVNVWYHVGSKNEKPGRTGFAHLFEHMMFQGSKHYGEDYFLPLEKIGGRVNGSTIEDRTNYWENVPSNYLELALWLEADRMGFLLPALTQEKLDNQRDVVKNERRQGLENQPYGKFEDMMPALLFPKDHPYSWTVIGSMADLSAASLEDVSEFFRTYYTPNNASLCIAGDFDPAQAKEWVEKYFGSIPAGPPVDRLKSWLPRLDGTRRAVAQDNVKLPRLYYAWHTPANYAPGQAEFELLASILASGKTSRLYKTLVYDRQIAQDVQSYQLSNELSSSFHVVATAREGHPLAELENAIDAELKKILETGITQAELSQAKNSYEARFIRSLEEVGGFGGRADALNRYNVMLGDPDRFQWDLERYTKISPSDIQKYARQYIDLDRRVILHIVPQGELSAAQEGMDRTIQPKPAPDPTFTPPAFQRSRLSNGLELLVVQDHGVPLVQAVLVIKSGFAADSPDRPGAASLTAELLDEGTKTRSALQISEEAKGLGATLSTSGLFDGSIIGLNVMKKNLDAGLELMADVILNPVFPAEELERQRQIYLGRIQQESKEPFLSAFKIFQRALFGSDHPYGQPFTGSGTQASMKAIQRTDLVTFHKANYYPNNAAVVIAGDITPEEARVKFEKVLGSWKPGSVTQREIPAPANLSKTKIYIANKSGAAQSVIVAGNLGIRRSDPDYVACQVMNNVFGGQFTSRLNMNLREDKGYSYGAGSFFLAPRGVGAFAAFAPVQTQNTKESIAEILKEIRDITAARPLTDVELTDSKNNLIKGFPQLFQTYSSIADQLSEIVMYDLPDDEWARYLKAIHEVNGAMATKTAKDHLHPEGLLIVVVGDREKIEPAIRELNLGEIGSLNVEDF